MNLPRKITICEVGPRDGLQSEKSFIPTDKKIELINKVIDSGVKIIEVGSFVHPKAVPQLADTSEVFAEINKREDVEFRALITNLKGVQRAIEAGVKKVKLTVSASESHNLSNFNRTPQQTIEAFADCVQLARENGLAISGAISTAFGCPFEGKIPSEQIKKLVRSFLELGVAEISLSDTTGVANPAMVNERCTEMINEFPQVDWILHFHNTRGMALANILAGMEAGVTKFDAAFAELGGCPYAPGASGNVSTEDLIHMCDEMGIETGIDLDKAIHTAKFATEVVGHRTEACILKAGKVSDLIKEKVTGQQKVEA